MQTPPIACGPPPPAIASDPKKFRTRKSNMIPTSTIPATTAPRLALRTNNPNTISNTDGTLTITAITTNNTLKLSCVFASMSLTNRSTSGCICSRRTNPATAPKHPPISSPNTPKMIINNPARRNGNINLRYCSHAYI